MENLKQNLKINHFIFKKIKKTVGFPFGIYKMFTINWESKIASGNGQPVTKIIGEAWVTELNKKYPDITHYLKPVNKIKK